MNNKKRLLLLLMLSSSAFAFDGSSVQLKDEALQKNHLYIYLSPLCAQCTLDLVWIKSFVDQKTITNYTLVASQKNETLERYISSLDLQNFRVIFDEKGEWIKKYKVTSLPAYVLTDPVSADARLYLGNFNLAEWSEISLNIANGFQQKDYSQPEKLVVIP